jgi:hypothetical protein
MSSEGVPPGWVATMDDKHRIVLHLMRPSGASVCGKRKLADLLPESTDCTNAKECKVCLRLTQRPGRR